MMDGHDWKWRRKQHFENMAWPYKSFVSMFVGCSKDGRYKQHRLGAYKLITKYIVNVWKKWFIQLWRTRPLLVLSLIGKVVLKNEIKHRPCKIT
jgi:hypothetical protein